MKLTNYARESFVNAVMADVPMVKMTRDEIQQAFLKAMPPKVKGLAKDPELIKHLRTTSLHVGGCSHYGIVCGNLNEKDVLSDVRKKEDARRDLRNKLTALAKGCSTVKQLKAAAPDLVKYMPSDDPMATPNLPVVYNVMADLKALGFKGAC